MFKKIEIWILYLTILLSILFAIFFGALVRQELIGSTKLGWASKTALSLANIPTDFIALMKGGGRASSALIVEDRFTALNGFDGAQNTEAVYLLQSRYDGNLEEGIVELVNLKNFEVLHTWNPDIDTFNNLVDAVDEFKFLASNSKNERTLIKHPKLLQDGGLLFSNDSPLIKIDACSNLIFQNTHDRFHHSHETDYEGNIWTSTHLYPQILPIEKVGRAIIEDGGYLDDAIVKLSNDGELLYEKSISEIFIENGLEHLLFSIGDNNFIRDPIHSNDVQPVNFDGEYWKKGDVFLSLRHQSMILLYRPSTNEIVWKSSSHAFHQHDVDILDDHRVSFFNNNSKNFFDGDVVDGHNEVIIYNFKTNEYNSYLKDSLKKNLVRTITAGRSEILSNGDLFVEESNYGRLLYFNADGSLRWTHVNRANNSNVYYIGWSRILYTDDDIESVNNFLDSGRSCNE